jgi:hypothetical protein
VPILPKEILVYRLILSKSSAFIRTAEEKFVMFFSLCATCNTNLTALGLTVIIYVTARLSGLDMMQTNTPLKCMEVLGHIFDTLLSLLVRYFLQVRVRKNESMYV